MHKPSALATSPDAPSASGRGHARRWRLPQWADRLGAFGAFVCALHCALIPVALAVVPVFGLGLAGVHRWETAFAALATVLAVVSLWLGYRGHRAYHAWLLVVPGLASIWTGLLVPELHAMPVVHAATMAVGGVLIGIAHLVNLRLSWGHSH